LTYTVEYTDFLILKNPLQFLIIDLQAPKKTKETTNFPFVDLLYHIINFISRKKRQICPDIKYQNGLTSPF
ncbi:hypothetical protein, partial [Fusobacterium sp. HMSC064B11]|uniref:hypothetical protein n=1 Tax=Fusobacterium sp. HMSC064B11 TaxID=1739543 RepID=UPI001AEF781C